MQVHVSQKHKMLGVPADPKLKNLFPQGKELPINGQQCLLLPHGVRETFMLRQLGYDAPSPILSQYDWAGGSPFDVQKKTCAMLTLNPQAFVLNDMGTGKTRSALWSWDFLYEQGLCGKALVVAPLSTLNFTWAREIFTTLPHRKYAVLHGTKERRIERLNDAEVDIYIINHDGIKVIEAELLAKVAAPREIDVLIIDELAVYRGYKSARTKSMRKFSAQFKWRWGMTGSPIPHCPTDAWAEATVIRPTNVPKYYSHFRDALMEKINQWVWRPKKDAVERAFEALQPAVRYTLDDVVELPDCVERFVDVELGTKQAKVYKELASASYTAVQQHEITAANAGAALMKLLQVSTGWVYTSTGQTVHLDNDKRIEALMDCINSTDRKVLVFVPFKHALDGIAAALTHEKIEHAVVSGDTPAKERDQIFVAFQQSSKYRVLAAHPQCLAHGITLTAADTIVWFGPVLSYEIYEQANRRIRRVGQKHKQQVLMLQSTPVEKKVYAALRTCQRVQDKLLELFEEATSNPGG